MAQIVIVGGGVVGLGTALLLDRSGHDVVVLERDLEGPLAEPEENWHSWERKGVNQFRLGHYFLSRYRRILDTELPDVAAALVRAGALQSPGPTDDGAFAVLTGRRSVVEAAVASVADSAPRLSIKRGVAVAGLVAGPTAHAGIAHVSGVQIESGERIPADLVVDMSGRRSALPRWLEAIGARPPADEIEDSGFMYFGRHFQSTDGTLPVVRGPLSTSIGTISSLTLPADNGTWSVNLVTSAKDKVLYGLRDLATWERTIKSLPLVAHWLDGQPIEDRVQSITKIEDRLRSLVLDGSPVATGVVAIGDAWACTNPSLGRGASIGMMHAVLLRDILASEGLDDQWAFANAFHDATAETIEPLYRDAVASDRHRLAEIEAGIVGREYRPDDPSFEVSHALGVAAGEDVDCLRAFMAVVSDLERAPSVLSRPGLLEKVLELGHDWRDRPSPGPSRAQLESIVAG